MFARSVIMESTNKWGNIEKLESFSQDLMKYNAEELDKKGEHAIFNKKEISCLDDILDYITIKEPNKDILEKICNIFWSIVGTNDMDFCLLPYGLLEDIMEIMEIKDVNPIFINMLIEKLEPLCYVKKYDKIAGVIYEPTDEIKQPVTAFYEQCLTRGIVSKENRMYLANCYEFDTVGLLMRIETDPDIINYMIENIAVIMKERFLNWYLELITLCSLKAILLNQSLTGNQLDRLFQIYQHVYRNYNNNLPSRYYINSFYSHPSYMEMQEDYKETIDYWIRHYGKVFFSGLC